jgi:uncharacterized protein
MTTIKTVLSLLIFVAFAALGNLQAQDVEVPADTAYVGGVGRYTGSEVLLRWGISSASIWRDMQKQQVGYTIERIFIGENGAKIDRLTPTPILPLPLEQWESRFDTENPYVYLAAEVLYNTESISTQGMNVFQTADHITNENRTRHGYALFAADMNLQAAEGLGLFFRDDLKDKPADAVWVLYKIYPHKALVNPHLTTVIDTAFVTLDLRQTYEPTPVVGLEIEEGDQQITLAWDREANRYFSAFRVERSQDGKNFTPLTELPLQIDEKAPFNFYIDSLPQNYVKYHYRVVGYTPFGDLGQPSQALVGQGIDLSPAAGFGEIHTQTLPDGSVKVIWQAIIEQPDLQGYYVARSLDIDNEFIYINEKPIKKQRNPDGTNTYEFVDKNPEKVFNSYYTVYSHDEKDNRSKSMTTMHILVDDEPPAQPTGLKGEIDSLGIVKLTWNEGTEADLLGYRIYYAHALEREFIPLTADPIADNVFYDSVSLNTLTEKIYYKIVANDLRYNASPYSEILVLQKPDTIAPNQPLIYEFEVQDAGVLLRFKRSSSEDVISHSVLRRKQGETKWETLHTFADPKDTTAQFLDKDVAKSVWYEYAMVATDDAKNVSNVESTLPIQFYDDGKRKVQPTLQAEFLKKEKQLRLFWNIKEDAPFRVMILKSQAGEERVLLTTVQGGEYIDYALVNNGKGFEYAIKLLYEDGTESALSNVVKIQF